MCVGTSTAIGIALAAGTTAAGIYAANTTAGASREAAGLQSTAAQQQLEYLRQESERQRQQFEATQAASLAAFNQTLGLNVAQANVGVNQFNQRQAQLQPYRDTGYAANAYLSQLIGLPAAHAPGGNPIPTIPYTPVTSMPTAATLPPAPPGSAPSPTPAPTPAPTPTPHMPAGFSSAGGSTTSPSPLTTTVVQMRAPTGEISQVPASLVALYQSHGATVIA